MLNFRLFLYDKYVCVCSDAVTSNSLWSHGRYSPPGSSVHGIFQARRLEWVAISSSRGSFQLRDRTWVSCDLCIGRRILYLPLAPPGKPHMIINMPHINFFFWEPVAHTYEKVLGSNLNDRFSTSKKYTEKFLLPVKKYS